LGGRGRRGEDFEGRFEIIFVFDTTSSFTTLGKFVELDEDDEFIIGLFNEFVG
jgi:hypothetical protein